MFLVRTTPLPSTITENLFCCYDFCIDVLMLLFYISAYQNKWFLSKKAYLAQKFQHQIVLYNLESPTELDDGQEQRHDYRPKLVDF